MIKTVWKPFDSLTPLELYQLIQLRIDVFIVEQTCLYQELDNKDQQANHLLLYENENLVGSARLLFDIEKNANSFGRLATARSVRGQGLGKAMMQEIMRYFQKHHPDDAIKISAQCYLKTFYQHFGFIPKGEPYKEDGLPHILMVHDGQTRQHA